MREPVVAGRFYPADKKELHSVIEEYTREARNKPGLEALAVMAPHAGYVYSGRLAGKTLATVQIPKTVLLIGPNHTGHGISAALSSQAWSTPLGLVQVNNDLIRLICKNSKIIGVDEAAHAYEHSLEVQIPFLQELQHNVSVVPLTLGQLSYEKCEEIAESLYQSIIGCHDKILILASTDMNHFESRSISQAKDRLALNAIEELDPFILYSTVHQNKISMCGVIPVVITLLVSRKLGAQKAILLDYTDSGDISGDTEQVVGYAGVIIQ